MRSPWTFGMLALSLIAGVLWAADPEYGGHCAMAMSKGAALPTNCSVFWVSPEDKLYCFISEAARDEFLKTPVANLQKATEFWEDPGFWERFNRQKQN